MGDDIVGKKVPDKSQQASLRKSSQPTHPQGEGSSPGKPGGPSPAKKFQQQGDQQQQAAAGGNKNNKKYALKKRSAPKEVPARSNDVFISEKSNFQAQISKCQRLFDGDHSEVYLHGLGSAIPRAINVAVELKKFYHGTVDYSVNTSTVKLIDDLIPLDDATPPSQQSRKVSCVDIRVFRTVKIP